MFIHVKVEMLENTLPHENVLTSQRFFINKAFEKKIITLLSRTLKTERIQATSPFHFLHAFTHLFSTIKISL